MQPYLFDINTPLGFSVHCTESYWKMISELKHPVMFDKLEGVKKALQDPDEIRRSTKDPRVFLFYRGDHPYWICAVTKGTDDTGFLVTAYLTDSIKVGDVLWKK
jgi:hypothetical protein